MAHSLQNAFKNPLELVPRRVKRIPSTLSRIPRPAPRAVAPAAPVMPVKAKRDSHIELDASFLVDRESVRDLPQATASVSGWAPRLVDEPRPAPPKALPPSAPRLEGALVPILAPLMAQQSPPRVATPAYAPPQVIATRARERLPTLAFVLPMIRPSLKALVGYLGVGVVLGVGLGAIALGVLRLVHHF